MFTLNEKFTDMRLVTAVRKTEGDESPKGFNSPNRAITSRKCRDQSFYDDQIFFGSGRRMCESSDMEDEEDHVDVG